MDMQKLVLTDMQMCPLTLAPKSAEGNPAPIDGIPTWTNSDPSILTLLIADDGMTASAIAVGPVGTVRVSVTADADIGAGRQTLTGIIDVQIVASQAVSLGIETGTPTDKPPEAQGPSKGGKAPPLSAGTPKPKR